MSKSIGTTAALSTLFRVSSKANPVTSLASVILYLTRIRKTYQAVSKAKALKEKIENVLDHATPSNCHDVELKFDEDRMQDFIVLYALFVSRLFNYHSDMDDKQSEIRNELRYLEDVISSFPLPISFHSDLDFCIRLTNIIGNSYISNLYPQCYTGVQKIASSFTAKNTIYAQGPAATNIATIVDSDPLAPKFKEVCELLNKLAPGSSKSVTKSYDAMITGSVKRMEKEWFNLLQVISTLSTTAELSNFYAPTRKFHGVEGSEQIPNFDSVALYIVGQVTQLSSLYNTAGLEKQLVANAGPMFAAGLTPSSRAIYQVTEVKKQSEVTMTTDDKILRELKKLNKSLATSSGIIVNDEDVESPPNAGGTTETVIASQTVKNPVAPVNTTSFSSKASQAKRDKGSKTFTNKLK